ncbi:F-box protein At1g61340-like [Vicia villosa]|uniref:F-box protein At1g61340-like n=1 Tax=Vicia villosa TaxID=3911 RepID=UPI00273BAC99|nr:F-box protein At1g61340-like [Vicia villosa]
MEIGFSKSLGRKRVVVSENMESFSSFTPLKRVYSARFNFNSHISLLESLPQDILLHVLCGVDHDDLKQLFHVSKITREATLVVKDSHFKFSTPKKKSFDSNDKFSEIVTPNAPLKKLKGSKFTREELSDISAVLFGVTDCTIDEDYE